ncbi:MAG: hypothetical protein H7836_04640 [Magnetococcus sp. YQC-3]
MSKIFEYAKQKIGIELNCGNYLMTLPSGHLIFIQTPKDLKGGCTETLYCNGRDNEDCMHGINDYGCKSFKQYLINNPGKEEYLIDKIEEYLISEL